MDVKYDGARPRIHDLEAAAKAEFGSRVTRIQIGVWLSRSGESHSRAGRALQNSVPPKTCRDKVPPFWVGTVARPQEIADDCIRWVFIEIYPMEHPVTEVDPDDMVSAEDAAKIIKQQVTTLSTWRSMGKGPRYIKAGRAVFYLRSDLRAWLATQMVDPAAA